MEFSDEETFCQKEAKKYIEEHKDELIRKFILDKKPLRINTLSFFMAGSPGAGKTEFTNNYMHTTLDKNDKDLKKILEGENIDINDVECLFVKIDVDEIRAFIPHYKKTDTAVNQKGNAHVVQSAANRGLDILRNFCFKNDISFLHDGTFGNYKTMRELVRKSVLKQRAVHIYYLYLDPLKAWEFTKAREFLEGRNIVKDKFISQFFDSQENIDKIKTEFGDKVKINCILKNNDNKVEEILLNQPNIAGFLEVKYNSGIIRKYTKEDLSGLLR